MKTPTKYVKTLTDAQRTELHTIMKSDAPQRKRLRAHAILLSDRRYSIDQIADIYQVDRDSVSLWIDHWESDQHHGLDDDPRSGRPRKLAPEQREQAVKVVLEEPRSLRQGLSVIATQLGKTFSLTTLKRLMVEAGYVWKRMRYSLRDYRNEAAFRAAQAELAVLRAQAVLPERSFDLWYFDQSGFSLTPSVPYAWQARKQTLELPCTRGPRQNVLGFLNLQNDLHSYVFEGSIHTGVVTYCIDQFVQTLVRPGVVVLDNASIHTSDEFQELEEEWRQRGLTFKFLPPYCPELNLIEILWRKIKYEWLPLDAYQNFTTLTESLCEVLKGVGSKYRITFA